ncbi:MAG: NAD(P)-dependent oxidoreductase [Planctomycetes bacterium]|nr:NAD(P)-dependent oxidoreductase [Planctomycetota bacterium]
MKYCITGGSGFIGRYFCERFARSGDEVTILDLVDPTPDTPHARYVKGDIRDPDACRDATAGCDRLVHLAAAHHDFGIEHDTFFDVNEQGTGILCEAMDEAGVRSACFYSTVAIYGDAPEPRTEETKPEPISPYGQSKLAGEKVLEGWTDQGDGRRCLVIRPTVTFGPRNFANMYTLIHQIARRRFVLVGRGENIKSLSYVENIVDATLYLWAKDDRSAFDVANFIDKPDLSSLEIASEVYLALGRKVPSMHLPMWLVHLLALPFDIVIAVTGKNLPISSARVKKMFSAQTKFEADRLLESGYEPAIPLRDGIRRMVDWYVAQGCKEKAEWHQPPAEVVRQDR